MPAVLVAVHVPTVTQNLLHPLSTSSTFWIYGAGKDNRGRRTDNPSGCHPVQTIGAPPPSSRIFMLNALSAATLPIYPSLGQAPNNAGVHAQWLGFHVLHAVKHKFLFC